MKTVNYPENINLKELTERPQIDSSQLIELVSGIISQVKQKGDQALMEYALKFDNVNLKNLEVSPEEFIIAEKSIEHELKNAIEVAYSNIHRFHENQRQEEITKIETSPGVFCWRKSSAIQKVGFYIPGGSAPLFSTVLMLGIPAAIAGCKEIVLCSPPDKNGNIHPAILFAAKKAGISKVYKAGGAQAIAAMAFGTATIPAVYKVFGPGNQFVTCAKQLINAQGIAIDMPAGPSEVMVVADSSLPPQFAAADLLSQAEHGPDSQVILLSTEKDYTSLVKNQIDSLLKQLPRQSIALKALENSHLVTVQSIEQCIDIINEYAPEHLIVCHKNQTEIINKVCNAGSIFIGPYSPESFGDYASGTNHVLPTNGFARAYSGVSLDSFVKKITYQEVSKDGIINLGPSVETLAAAEELDAHKLAVTVRLNYLKGIM